MSFVSVMVVRDNKVCFFSCHYRTLLGLFDKSQGENKEGFNRIFELAKRQNYLDAGWLAIDCDRAIVVSSQDAFPVTRLKNWNVVEV